MLDKIQYIPEMNIHEFDNVYVKIFESLHYDVIYFE